MHAPRSFIDRIEENLIALILGLMVAITFTNVILRKFFQSGLLWGLEATVFPLRRWMALFAVAVCIAFSALLLKGAWDYWANFANLPQTTGRWFPDGFQEKFRAKGWYEVDDIPMPDALQWIGGILNDGERYEKIPRAIPYLVLPLSMALLLFRYLQIAWRVWRGDLDRIVASHEVEEELIEASAPHVTNGEKN